MGEPRPKSLAALQFVERFDDFFERGVQPAIAFGLVLAWVWVGLTEGYPVFMDGLVDLPSVIILLLSFAGFLLVVGFLHPAGSIMGKPAAWLALSMLASAVCLFLLAMYYGILPLENPFRLVVVRVSMVILGFNAGMLVMCCAVGYACLRPVSAGVGFAFAIAVMFAAFFCLVVCEWYVKGVLFCFLPALSAFVLFRSKASIVDRWQLRSEDELPFAKGFLSMCLAFCVFFFAIGAKCAFEPVSEFAEDSNTSVVGILAVSLVFLYAIGLRQKPMGMFHALKLAYSAAVMLLTVCIAIAPLSIEPYVGIVYNADVVVMIMVLWLLTAFVAHFNEAHIGKIAALAFGTAALGMAVGWFVGTVLYQVLGHDRSYPTIAIACATAVFSTVGFSGKNFPYLTHRGEGAKKMTKPIAPYEPADYCSEAAQRCHLSERETEVLALLVAGYGADAISEKLIVSYHTARTHVRNIYKKMDVHSQRELLDDYEAVKASREGRDVSE